MTIDLLEPVASLEEMEGSAVQDSGSGMTIDLFEPVASLEVMESSAVFLPN